MHIFYTEGLLFHKYFLLLRRIKAHIGITACYCQDIKPVDQLKIRGFS
ncbi:hypothetical protein BXY64_3548 [Marinifilum flexuosum]|uniref:Uncharacterized protein n=1 Tax=Marinifilum flexuosum TaxID=1117708 RepID=A0A419WTC0_9BACT|nr:hypothetical protein BXY64_3548 [Marinifilum flexuosum]